MNILCPWYEYQLEQYICKNCKTKHCYYKDYLRGGTPPTNPCAMNADITLVDKCKLQFSVTTEIVFLNETGRIIECFRRPVVKYSKRLQFVLISIWRKSGELSLHKCFLCQIRHNTFVSRITCNKFIFQFFFFLLERNA